jgi:hypothetical protein
VQELQQGHGFKEASRGQFHRRVWFLFGEGYLEDGLQGAAWDGPHPGGGHREVLVSKQQSTTTHALNKSHLWAGVPGMRP